MKSESIALVEAESYLKSAQIVQMISRDSNAEVVHVETSTTGGRTIIITGALSDLQYALGLIENIAGSSALFPRPTPELRKYLRQDDPAASAGKPAGEAEPLYLFSGLQREDDFSHSISTNGHRPNSLSRQDNVLNGLSRQDNGGRMEKSKPGIEFGAIIPLHELEDMPVHELRHYARSLPDFPIAGRGISRANKAELLQMFKSTEEKRNTLRAQHNGVLSGPTQP